MKPIALQMPSIKMQARAKPTSSRTSVFGLTRKRAILDQHSSALHKPIGYIQSCGKICPTLLQGELDNLRYKRLSSPFAVRIRQKYCPNSFSVDLSSRDLSFAAPKPAQALLLPPRWPWSWHASDIDRLSLGLYRQVYEVVIAFVDGDFAIKWKSHAFEIV